MQKEEKKVTRMTLMNRAVGKWGNILQALGVPSHIVSGKHQPCPICKNGTDTFRFDNRSPLGVWHCGYCHQDRKLGLDFLKGFFNVDTAEAMSMLEDILGKGIEPVKIKKRDPAPVL
ncbi:MAG: primase-helicase zinc-binding domain-containing protein, partial [Bacteroides sp.]